MAVTTINPPGLVEPQGYMQMSVATGSRMIFLSGQVGEDVNGQVVGVGDLAAQTEQALRNVDTALRAAGASYADVAKTTVYVVDWRPEKMADLVAGAERAALGPIGATTLIGVAALADPDLLIEFDVTAVVD